MKKFIFVLVLFILFPLSVLGVNYDIKHFYQEATILENGDVEVRELIVLKGNFNGYERDLVYGGSLKPIYNARDITDVKISAKPVGKDVSFDTMYEEFESFTEDYSATNGDKGKYILSNIPNGYRYRMYYKTDGRTAFLLEYTIKDAVVVHSDVAELYYNFIGKDFEDDLEDVKIKVILPGKDSSDNFHFWFHGDLAGESEEIKNALKTTVLANIKKNYAGESIDARVLFSKDLVNEIEVSKKTNEVVLKEIIDEEDEYARQANELRKEMRNKYYTVVVLTGTFYLFLILAWIYIYKRYDKERKPIFQNEYNREFIDDYNVEVIDYLMNKSITPNAMSAAIMNLIYKKNITYEEMPDKKKNYKFILVNRDNLNETENMLVDFLFTKVGSGTEFSTVELKKYASSTKTCDKFMSSYTKWNNQVIKDAKAEKFFETGEGKFKFGLIVFVFALIVQILVASYKVEFIPAYFCIFMSVIFILYLAFSTKKTEKGIEHYARWKAFKKFLEDFGTFDVKELPEITLWERYLVYATIFGLADRVEKAMNVRIKEIDVSNYPMDTIYIGPRIHIAPVINSSIHSAYRGAQTTITQERANSSSSSFGGSGGGFSSGGGFGGGGGGGRGF